MKRDAHVQVQKLKEAPNANVAAGNPETYNYGGDDPLSVPVEYTVKGHLVHDLQVGGPAMINRYERNGIKLPGMMVTSVIRSIEGNRFTTDNSVYQVTLL